MPRVILPDCCEDWILAYGPFYASGTDFACIECGRPWRKIATGQFLSLRDERIWVQRERVSEGVSFAYLESADAANPTTERCCTKILLRHGPRLRTGTAFTCPICGTGWTKAEREQGGIRVPCFHNRRLNVDLAIVEGAHRSFLVPLDEYTLPSDR